MFFSGLGGYLQAVVLPIANENYYAGNVDYRVMAQLYYLFEELKVSSLHVANVFR